MVIGAAGPLPQAPEKATVFLEGIRRMLAIHKSELTADVDMDDSELAEAVGYPVYLPTIHSNSCPQLAKPVGLRK